MDGSRIDLRTVVLAFLCLAALSFAAATLDTTTSTDTALGMGQSGQGDQLGGERTPADQSTGDSESGGSPLDFGGEAGALFGPCVEWLQGAAAQAALLLGLVSIFFLGRWLDDAATGLGMVVIVGYPGFFVYLLLTSCNSQTGQLLDLSNEGQPAQEGGGLFGGGAMSQSPTLVTNLLLVGVVLLLGVVAVLVLTSDHDQAGLLDGEAAEADDDPEPEGVDVAAVGAAAGRAADRIERDGAFENEVYRAWAEMTDSLSVDHPESSTPGEFAAAAVDAGMDREDVERLTRLFADVRYGGADPTEEREAAAVETLRSIEATYGGEE